MRVVFSFLFFGVEMTGGARVLATLIDLLADRVDPLVLTQRESPLTELLRASRIPLQVVPLPEGLARGRGSHRPLWWRAPAFLRAIGPYNEAVEAAAAAHRPQVWWGRNVWTVLLSVDAARRLGAPFIWDLALEPSASPLIRPLYWRALARCDCVVTESPGLQRRAFGAGARRRATGLLVTIPSGLAPARITALRAAARERRASECLRVLCLGSISPRKNQLLLVNALQRMGSYARHLRVTLAGDQPDPAYARRVGDAIRRSGLESVVHVAGWTDDVATLMRDMDVVVSCSRDEGVPLVVREAAFAGLPVIATAVGGIPDVIVQDATGRLIPTGDAAALAAELVKAVTDRAAMRMLGDAAAAGADERYSPWRWADRYYELMTELAGTTAR